MSQLQKYFLLNYIYLIEYFEPTILLFLNKVILLINPIGKITVKAKAKYITSSIAFPTVLKTCSKNLKFYYNIHFYFQKENNIRNATSYLTDNIKKSNCV